MVTTVDEVRSIQLYALRENALPIHQLRGGPSLTLEFDVLGNAPRPLSIYFYHANRDWERDLYRSEYMSSFHRDDLYDYEMSTTTRLPYIHYRYEFPNTNTGFLLSGNYVLRISEQGQEDRALFERPFYVVEGSAPSILSLENVLAGGQSGPVIQPFLRFTPPPDIMGGVFNYSVCFLRNGDHRTPRCTERPSLTVQPDLLFYLDPSDGFRNQEGNYYVDLRRLQPGGHVEKISLVTSPYEVLLYPDYARFPSTSADPLLSGQSVISRAQTYSGDPDTSGEYAQVQFRYVPPDEQRLPGGVYLAGSFNGWRIDLAKQLRWVPDQGYYEGAMLLKQGEHEYRYTSPDPAVRRALRVRLPRPDNQYTALVYYRDASYNTDRLLAYQHGFSQ